MAVLEQPRIPALGVDVIGPPACLERCAAPGGLPSNWGSYGHPEAGGIVLFVVVILIRRLILIVSFLVCGCCLNFGSYYKCFAGSMVYVVVWGPDP